MTSLESRCLDGFPAWLRLLADDARALSAVLEAESSDTARHAAAVALTYLFKSLDLIPDGLEDLGYIDDAFVLRVAAARVPPGERGADASGVLERLAGEAQLIAEFLGPEYGLLETYVDTLGSSAARGRSVRDVLQDDAVRDELVSEVRRWADDYAAPAFLRDEKNLVKLRAFLTTRLAAT